MSTIVSTGRVIGVSVPRPDGIPKVKGEFEFSSDLWAEGMLWAQILQFVAVFVDDEWSGMVVGA